MAPPNNEPPKTSRGSAKGRSTQSDEANASAPDPDGVQGEGNYTAARRFNEAERKFVESGKVAEGARQAAPKSETEAQEMLAAEREGKDRAKEEDPALTKPWPNSPASRGDSKDKGDHKRK